MKKVMIVRIRMLMMIIVLLLFIELIMCQVSL